MVIFGKLQIFFHSFFMYSLSPTRTTCFSSSSSKLLALRGMMRFLKPIMAEWASAKTQTTMWLLITVIAACSLVCKHSNGFLRTASPGRKPLNFVTHGNTSGYVLCRTPVEHSSWVKPPGVLANGVAEIKAEVVDRRVSEPRQHQLIDRICMAPYLVIPRRARQVQPYENEEIDDCSTGKK